MTQQFYAYVHLRPDREGVHSIFYVGKGTKQRAKALSRNNIHHRRIVSRFGAENIVIRKLACESESHALNLEVAMIASLRGLGVKITNRTDGGDGSPGLRHTQEAKDKVSRANKGRIHSAEARRNMGDSKRGIRMSDTARKNMSIARRKEIQEKVLRYGYTKSPEVCEKHSLAMMKAYESPELRLKISNSVKKYQEDNPEQIQGLIKASVEYWSTDEARELAAERARKQSSSPEYRAAYSEKMQHFYNNKEAQKAHSEFMKERAKDPIVRVRTSLAILTYWARRKGIPFSPIELKKPVKKQKLTNKGNKNDTRLNE